MDQELVIAVAGQLAQQWAQGGGGPQEYGVAIRGGELMAIAEIERRSRLNDTNRRGILGMLARATECDTFAYIADTQVTIGGEPGEALLCLELAIVDMAGKVVGAAAHLAPYTRQPKRFGRDVIELGPFERLESAGYGEFASELMASWSSQGDHVRLNGLDLLRQAKATLSDVHPTMSAEIQALLEAEGS